MRSDQASTAKTEDEGKTDTGLCSDFTKLFLQEGEKLNTDRGASCSAAVLTPELVLPQGQLQPHKK